jgi:hypothetical protein
LWVELITTLRPAIPRRWQVYALTDRGLYSKRLFKVLCNARWHPMMRIRAQGNWRRKRAKTWKNLANLARPSMGNWCQRVVCFKGDPLECTLAVCWDAQYREPWLILTDLKPAQVKPNFYALRAWIESGFEDVKRGGLHWEQTKMTDPARAERLWLVMAIAMLWLVRVGGEAQVIWQALLPSPVGPARLSCLRLGWLTILAAAFKQYPLPKGHFCFADWPKVPQ